MGAWGTGHFENDAALDWVEEAVEADSLESLVDHLVDEMDGEVELEAPLARTALCLGELVAAAGGRPGGRLPGALTRWLEGADVDLPRAKAEALLVAVADAADPARSELAREHAASGQLGPFLEEVRGLTLRLRPLATGPRPLSEA